MGDPLQASNAWAMGNVGLSNSMQGAADFDSYDDEDLGNEMIRPSWVVRLRRRVFRWSLGIGVFLAWANHWPSGH